MKFTVKSYSFPYIKGFINKEYYVKRTDELILKYYYRYKNINHKTSVRQCI